MESVYNRPFPNRFLSTISYFLADYTNDDYVFNLITSNLRSFSLETYVNTTTKTTLFDSLVRWPTAMQPY